MLIQYFFVYLHPISTYSQSQPHIIHIEMIWKADVLLQAAPLFNQSSKDTEVFFKAWKSEQNLYNPFQSLECICMTKFNNYKELDLFIYLFHYTSNTENGAENQFQMVSWYGMVWFSLVCQLYRVWEGLVTRSWGANNSETLFSKPKLNMPLPPALPNLLPPHSTHPFLLSPPKSDQESFWFSFACTEHSPLQSNE